MALQGTGSAGSRIGWRVVSQVEQNNQAPTGRFVEGVKVTAALDDGTAFSVFIPKASYSATAVKNALMVRAQEVANIQGMSG